MGCDEKQIVTPPSPTGDQNTKKKGERKQTQAFVGLTVERLHFQSVGGGGAVGGPADAERVIANVVGGQVRHIQVH